MTARRLCRTRQQPTCHRHSTLDLFGRGYALPCFGAAEAPDLEAAARARGVPFDVVAVPDRKVAELYERRLVLVRPDGHVCWRADDPPHDPTG